MIYSDDEKQIIIDEICERIISGESLNKICRDEHMPHIVTVIRWLNGDDEHAKSIARARVFHSDKLYEDIQDVTKKIEDGELDPQAGKAVIWAKQWSAGRMSPRKFGERILTDHISSDGSMSPKAITLDTSKLSTSALKELMAAMPDKQDD